MVTALIGPNGSGKTTLVRAVSGVISVESGEIFVDNTRVNSLSISQRSRLMSVVPQMRTLPPAFTVREVVSLGRTPYLNWLGQLSDGDTNIINLALEQTDLKNLETRNISDLSGGEQQRVLLARALAQQTPVLLMDEPTAHLDLQYQVNLLQRVHRLAHPINGDISADEFPRSVVIAMHDLNLLGRYADRVVLLVDGNIAADGTPAEVLQPGILSEAYHLPLHVLVDDTTGDSLIIPKK
jgi:iron complex transport system ATP-binding protein